MTSYNASELIVSTISAFSAKPDSLHEQLSRVDFVARLTLALAIPGALELPDFQIKIPCSPGLATLKEALGRVKDCVSKRPFSRIALAGYDLLATQLPSPDPVLQSVEGLRNHLFHGGALPATDYASMMAATLVAATDTVAATLSAELSNTYIVSASTANGPSSAIFRLGDQDYPLSPLMAFSKISNSLIVFSRITSSSVVLNAPKYEAKHQISRGECGYLLKRLFRTQQPTDSLMSDFTQAVLEDLEGFREPGSSVSYVAEADGVYVHWVHADGNGPTVRQDRFRIGPDNAWQWYDSNAWSGYSNLLRLLSNWPILTQRLGHILRERASGAKREENVLLPVPDGVHPPFIAPTIGVAQLGGKKIKCSFDDFTSRLDGDVKANRGMTYLYFIHAEAGAGKTTALLEAAQRRAIKSAEGNRQEPIFLYVSARGNVLENLDQAVDATVAETRLLTSAGVRALCRNGLVIPIIDGFDELVGSPTYADALASLRPWLQSLGGRGVLVVSSRSNYFVSLYEDSIRRETNQDINVTHMIAEMDRWEPRERDNYLRRCGLGNPDIQRLPFAEQQMLRLPFFARASIGYLLSGGGLNGGGLLSTLMRGYIEREQIKLQGPGGELLVTAQDLQRFFEELATYMMENNTREVPLDELILNAEVSIASPLSPEVKNRLVALCGLDVNEGRDRRFRFLHELILDYFFGCRIGQELRAKQSGRLRRVLSCSQLTTGAGRVAVQICMPNPADLAALLKPELGSSETSPLRSNIGLLWCEVFASPQKVSDIEIESVECPPMSICNRALQNVRFVACTFAPLDLDNLDAYNVQFVRCKFRELRLNKSGPGITFDNCSIDIVSTPDTYEEDPDAVRHVLSNAGATVIAPEYGKTNGKSVLEQRAEVFLRKIDASAAVPIVIGTNRLPSDDNGRLRWVTRDTDSWLAFLRALEQYSLLSLVPLAAGGPPKLRFRWAVPPKNIIERDASVPQVEKFWTSVSK